MTLPICGVRPAFGVLRSYAPPNFSSPSPFTLFYEPSDVFCSSLNCSASNKAPVSGASSMACTGGICGVAQCCQGMPLKYVYLHSFQVDDAFLSVAGLARGMQQSGKTHIRVSPVPNERFGVDLHRKIITCVLSAAFLAIKTEYYCGFRVIFNKFQFIFSGFVSQKTQKFKKIFTTNAEIEMGRSSKRMWFTPHMWWVTEHDALSLSAWFCCF